MTEIEIVEKILKRKDIPKKKLSKMIGMSETGMYDIFKKRDTKISVLRKIADALNVDICVFFNKDFNEKTVINSNYNSTTVENKHLQNEIELLKKTIGDKEKIIELLTNK